MSNKHTHKYYKAYTSPDEFLWTCALSTCSHHMPKHYEITLKNKQTICWQCGEKTTLDSRTMAMDKPLCTDCDQNALNIESPIKDIDDATMKVLVEMGIIEKKNGE